MHAHSHTHTQSHVVHIHGSEKKTCIEMEGTAKWVTDWLAIYTTTEVAIYGSRWGLTPPGYPYLTYRIHRKDGRTGNIAGGGDFVISIRAKINY